MTNMPPVELLIKGLQIHLYTLFTKINKIIHVEFYTVFNNKSKKPLCHLTSAVNKITEEFCGL